MSERDPNRSTLDYETPPPPPEPEVVSRWRTIPAIILVVIALVIGLSALGASNSSARMNYLTVAVAFAVLGILIRFRDVRL